MKRFCLFFLLGIFLPNIIFANISEELNNLFREFFDKDAQNINWETEKLNIPKIVLPPNPTNQDLQNFIQKIREQETELQNFEKEILDTQAELFELSDQKNIFEQELFLLDIDLSIYQQKLDKLREQENIWQEKKEKLEYELDNLKAETRFAKEDLNKLLATNFIREENFGLKNQTKIFEWIFSEKSVSQILEKNRLSKSLEKQKMMQLSKLKKLEKLLSDKEEMAQEFFTKFSNLRESMETQTKILFELTKSKAQKLDNIKNRENSRQILLKNNQKYEQESLIFLQELHKKKQELENKIKENTELKDEDKKENLNSIWDFVETSEVKKIWQSPIRVETKITAKFLDPVYEEQMNRPHLGVDFLIPQNTKIYAPMEGIVKKVQFDGLDYAYLILDHGDDIYSLYGHLSEILVAENEQISTGQIIALSGGGIGIAGSGAYSTGEHLHLEVFSDGKHQDPLSFFE